LGTTWEEKDATDWCTKTLKRCLLDAPASPYFSELSSTACVASVKGVLDVKGDASVAIAGWKKRYIFDYHATVGRDIRRGGRSRRVWIVEAARGAQREYVLREEEEELEVEVLAWKRAKSSPSRDDNIGASITAQEASNVEGYSSRMSGRAFWDLWRIVVAVAVIVIIIGHHHCHYHHYLNHYLDRRHRCRHHCCR
jgi:hypothetical protein